MHACTHGRTRQRAQSSMRAPSWITCNLHTCAYVFADLFERAWEGCGNAARPCLSYSLSRSFSHKQNTWPCARSCTRTCSCIIVWLQRRIHIPKHPQICIHSPIKKQILHSRAKKEKKKTTCLLTNSSTWYKIIMLYHVLFLVSKPSFLLHSCAVGWVKKEIRKSYAECLSHGHSANPTNSSPTLNNFVFLDPQFSTTWTATMHPTRWYPSKCLARKPYPKQTGGVDEVHVRGKATSTGTFASIRMKMGAWT